MVDFRVNANIERSPWGQSTEFHPRHDTQHEIGSPVVAESVSVEPVVDIFEKWGETEQGGPSEVPVVAKPTQAEMAFQEQVDLEFPNQSTN